jgi:chromosomal replication initiator protein
MVCRLEPAEYETRLGIVRNQAAQLGMQVPEEVAEYIATHFTSQSRELAGALKKLQATSFAHEQPITLDLAESSLRELLDHQSRVVNLVDIERAVCDVCGIQAEILQSAAKGAHVSHPRMLAMWLARKYTRAGLSEIGTYFGRRSHSTVISAQRKVEGWKANGSVLKTAGGGLSLNEMIRRVEERLRA